MRNTVIRNAVFDHGGQYLFSRSIKQVYMAASHIIDTDGEAILIPNWIMPQQAVNMFDTLSEVIDWRQETVTIAGRQVKLPRLTAWYGDQGLSYQYSGLTHLAPGWISSLKELAEKIGIESGGRFNSVLCNYYRDGADYVGWHSDNESSLGEEPIIATLSLGGTRQFAFKHKATGQKESIVLESGSLLIMRGVTQQHWLHTITKTKRPTNPRISLTFRKIVC